MSNDKEDVKALYDTLAGIITPEEMELFLGDLCTFKELDSMAQRIKAAKMLMEGKTYEEIAGKQRIRHSARITGW